MISAATPTVTSHRDRRDRENPPLLREPGDEAMWKMKRISLGVLF